MEGSRCIPRDKLRVLPGIEGLIASERAARERGNLIVGQGLVNGGKNLFPCNPGTLWNSYFLALIYLLCLLPPL